MPDGREVDQAELLDVAEDEDRARSLLRALRTLSTGPDPKHSGADKIRRAPEAARSRRWFVNKSLLAGGVAAMATMTGCSSDSADTANSYGIDLLKLHLEQDH
ncbi:hypothetical protein ACIRP7_33590 [Streptomyces sp. NPDC102270]|uniref:hypothetical protein n=1 Tax=Streptomyces sp. NPDC102270 TaxID=3366150 RepID=UPI00380882AF